MSIESFIPPKPSIPTMWFADFSFPLVIKLMHNLDNIVIQDEDREMLRKYRNERLIYFSNHPTTKEPPVAYHIANVMQSRFYFMAAREVFDWAAGFVGDFIQSLGAFSVMAGTADRESLKTTRAILASTGGKLVLFPEGEPTSAENDSLLPFQPGVSQLGFWGLEDARKVDKNADIFILPSFVKYRMNGSKDSLRSDIDRSLDHLENILEINKAGKTAVHRMLSVGKRIMERAEREFGIPIEEEQTFDFRIGRLRHTILNNIAKKIKIKKWNKDDHAIDKLRKILSTIEMVMVGVEDPKNELPSMDAARWARQAAQKAYDFIVIKVDYLTSFPSAERIYEWLYRFENDLLGKTNPRPNTAYVSFAKPFGLSEYYAEYKKDKKSAVENMTIRLRKDVEGLLEAEKKKCEILFNPEYKF